MPSSNFNRERFKAVCACRNNLLNALSKYNFINHHIFFFNHGYSGASVPPPPHAPQPPPPPHPYPPRGISACNTKAWHKKWFLHVYVIRYILHVNDGPLSERWTCKTPLWYGIYLNKNVIHFHLDEKCMCMSSVRRANEAVVYSIQKPMHVNVYISFILILKLLVFFLATNCLPPSCQAPMMIPRARPHYVPGPPVPPPPYQPPPPPVCAPACSPQSCAPACPTSCCSAPQQPIIYQPPPMPVCQPSCAPACCQQAPPPMLPPPPPPAPVPAICPQSCQPSMCQQGCPAICCK